MNGSRSSMIAKTMVTAAVKNGPTMEAATVAPVPSIDDHVELGVIVPVEEIVSMLEELMREPRMW
jgi:hypothetical protein